MENQQVSEHDEDVPRRVREALKEREPYIVENIETLTSKLVRKMLEEDTGINLESKVFKKQISDGLDEIMARVEANATGCQGSEDAQEHDSSPNKAVEHLNGNKRKAASEQATHAPAAKKQRVKKSSGLAGEGKLNKLKKMVKSAGLRLTPHFYRQHKDLEARCAGMEEELKKHGLDISSGAEQVRSVKKHLELQRDLEGVDTSNIIDDDGRRPSRTGARRSYKALLDRPGSDDVAAENAALPDGVDTKDASKKCSSNPVEESDDESGDFAPKNGGKEEGGGDDEADEADVASGEGISEDIEDSVEKPESSSEDDDICDSGSDYSGGESSASE